MTTVFLLTTGDGSDGNEWGVLGVYSARELAEKSKKRYESPRPNIYGNLYSPESQIEEWEVDKDQFIAVKESGNEK